MEGGDRMSPPDRLRTRLAPFQRLTRGPSTDTLSLSLSYSRSLQEKKQETYGNAGMREQSRFDIWWDWIQDSWITESAACYIAFAGFVVECVVLGWSSNRLVSQWPLGFQINSALAFLDTVSSVALTYAVTSCLGQQKWLWFRSGEEKLVWLDRLSHATNALGAAQLLYYLLPRRAWRTWASLGAVVTIIILGTSIATQNTVVRVLTTWTLPGENTATWVAIAQSYDSWFSGESPGRQTATSSLMNAITTGFAAPFSSGSWTSNSASLVSCPGVNCTYGVYTTVAACSTCADISSDVRTNGNFAALSDGSLILGETAIVNMTSDTNYPTTRGFDDIGPLIVRYKAMSWGAGNGPPAARECAAFWCVQSLNGTVENGVFRETVIENFTNSSKAAQKAEPAAEGIIMTTSKCWQNGTQFSDRETCSFSVTAAAQRGLQNFLTVGALGSPAFLSGYQETIGNDSGRWRTTSYAAQNLGQPCQWGKAGDTGCNDAMYAGLTQAFESMCAYMNTAVRLASAQGAQFSYGQAWISDYRFHIRWAWVVYIAVVLSLAIIFVASTILTNPGQKPWKASILPAMFHGLRDLHEEDYRGLASPADMRRRAEQSHVTLAEGGGGFRRAESTLPKYVK